MPRPAPRARLALRRFLRHAGDIAQVDRRPGDRAHLERAHFAGSAHLGPGHDRCSSTALSHRSRRKGAVGLRDRLDEVADRDLVKRQPGGIGNDADRLLLSPDDKAQTDVIDLGEFGSQAGRQLVKRLLRPLAWSAWLRTQGKNDDRHVVNSAHGDLRRWNANRNTLDIRVDLLVHPGRRVLGIGADEEPCSDQNPVVLGLGVDVLDPVDALDDRFERPGDDLDRVARRQSRRSDANVDHRHADLRFFLARNGHRRDQSDANCREKKQRR